MERLRYGGILAALAPAVLALVVLAPPASAVRPDCLVVDTNADQSYPALQDAVAAATAGDTLFVKGTCAGTTTVDKDLTVVGHSNGGMKTAILNGNHQGPVLTIGSGVEVTLTNLVITGGGNTFTGGGIFNVGTVTLNDSSISGNTASFGGGIYNVGTVTLNDSSISGNTAQFRGGGIYHASGTVNLNAGSSISGNVALGFGGGGGIYSLAGGGAVVHLNGGTVSGNSPDDIVNSPGS